MAWMLADAQRSCCVHQYMRIHKSRSNSHACGEQVASKATTGPQYQQIKLALDVHAASILVGRMIDGAKPPPHALARPAGEQPLVESGLVEAFAAGISRGAGGATQSVSRPDGDGEPGRSAVDWRTGSQSAPGAAQGHGPPDLRSRRDGGTHPFLRLADTCSSPGVPP